MSYGMECARYEESNFYSISYGNVSNIRMYYTDYNNPNYGLFINEYTNSTSSNASIGDKYILMPEWYAVSNESRNIDILTETLTFYSDISLPIISSVDDGDNFNISISCHALEGYSKVLYDSSTNNAKIILSNGDEYSTDLTIRTDHAQGKPNVCLTFTIPKNSPNIIKQKLDNLGLSFKEEYDYDLIKDIIINKEKYFKNCKFKDVYCNDLDEGYILENIKAYSNMYTDTEIESLMNTPIGDEYDKSVLNKIDIVGELAIKNSTLDFSNISIDASNSKFITKKDELKVVIELISENDSYIIGEKELIYNKELIKLDDVNIKIPSSINKGTYNISVHLEAKVSNQYSRVSNNQLISGTIKGTIGNYQVVSSENTIGITVE